MEYELFVQTALTFDDDDSERPDVPSAMDNLQLTKLLALWKKRVIDQAQGERAAVLRLQFDEIARLKESRDALVHGMWHWSLAGLRRISTVRVRRKQVITMHFTVDDLKNFSERVADINFRIRYPGGVEDLSRARAEQGYGISRRWLATLTDDPLSNDWMTAPPQSKSERLE